MPRTAGPPERCLPRRQASIPGGAGLGQAHLHDQLVPVAELGRGISIDRLAPAGCGKRRAVERDRDRARALARGGATGSRPASRGGAARTGASGEAAARARPTSARARRSSAERAARLVGRAVASLRGGESGVPARADPRRPRHQVLAGRIPRPRGEAASHGTVRGIMALCYGLHTGTHYSQALPGTLLTCLLRSSIRVARASKSRARLFEVRRKPLFPGKSLSNLPVSLVRGNSRRNVGTVRQYRGDSIRD